MHRLLRPRWLLLHLIAVAAVVVTVALGLWQLRRLDERRDRNELVEARMAEPAAPVGDLVDPGDDADPLRFRAVTATGTFTDEAVSVRTTLDGAAGGFLYQALDLVGGESVWVLRGFGAVDGEGVVVDAPAPAGEVTVDGIAVPVDRLPRTSRRQLDVDGDRLPVVVQAADAAAPLAPVPTPDLDDGPHLSYAVQWFLFAGVTVAGYPFLLRRRLRED